MTASVTFSPRYASASLFSFWRIIALISGGLKVLSLPSLTTMPSDFGSLITSYGTRPLLRCTSGSSKRRPMKRLMLKTVFSGLVIACRLATWPTSRSPLFGKATTDGVVRPPSALVMTCGSPPSITATTEFVVPRSMPMILPIGRQCSFGLFATRTRLGRITRSCRRYPRCSSPITWLSGWSAVSSWTTASCRFGSNGWPTASIGRHPLRLEDVAQLALRQPHALDPWVVRVGRHVLERTVEVVQDVQHLADQHRVAELRQRRALLIGAPLVVREVGGRAMPLVAVLRVAALRLGELALELLDALRKLGARRGLDRVGPLLAPRPGCARPRAAVRRFVGHCVSP